MNTDWPTRGHASRSTRGPATGWGRRRNWPTRGHARGSTRGPDSGYGGVTLGRRLAPTAWTRNRLASKPCPTSFSPTWHTARDTRRLSLYYLVKVSPPRRGSRSGSVTAAPPCPLTAMAASAPPWPPNGSGGAAEVAEFKVFEVRFDFIPGRFSKSLKWGSKTFKDFEVRFDFIPGMGMGMR